MTDDIQDKEDAHVFEVVSASLEGGRNPKAKDVHALYELAERLLQERDEERTRANRHLGSVGGLERKLNKARRFVGAMLDAIEEETDVMSGAVEIDRRLTVALGSHWRSEARHMGDQAE